MPNGKQLYWFEGVGPNEPMPLCDKSTGDLQASAYYVYGVVVFCPRQLEEPHWSMDGELSRIQKDGFIDDYAYTIAQTWVHEWGHLLYNCKIRNQRPHEESY